MTSIGLQFPKLPANLPSHENVDQQRFHSTKKPRAAPKLNWKKPPTDLQKKSIQIALDNSERSSELIHTDFDHSYDIVPLN